MVLEAATGWHEGGYGVGTDDYGFGVYAGDQYIFMNNGEFTGAAGVVLDLDKHEGQSIRCMYDKEMTQE